MRHTAQPHPISVDQLVAAALECSAFVRVLSDAPLIRDTAIIEADAAFDWKAFMETAWNDVDEPVGSTLTTGGPPGSRFKNQLFEYDWGVRKQNTLGGRFEIGQRYGWERSNSAFFVPNNQGTARLTLSYSQPLLRGAGTVYNTGLVLLAQIDATMSRQEFSRELQNHLLEVSRAYWSLYLERGGLLQRQRLYNRGKEVLENLEHRQEIDAVTNQIVRAQAAVTARRSNLYRAAAAVKNAEGRIRALVNAPDLGVLDEKELVPTDVPTTEEIPVDLSGTMETAVRHRPEIQQSMEQIKASAVRVKMSKNELLPALDLVLETYVAGLRGESDIGSAFTDQFQAPSTPSYSAGLQFEMPFGNREAKARYQRRALEVRQFENQFRSTLYALRLEVEIAVREVQTAYREIEAKHQAMEAAQSEVNYITQRWELLPGDDRAASLVLEDLLAAQDRLAIEEFEFLDALVTYNLALMNLKRATGMLLQCERVVVGAADECGLPTLLLHKDAAHGAPAAAPP
jgi:outer membrane protein TolC